MLVIPVRQLAFTIAWIWLSAGLFAKNSGGDFVIYSLPGTKLKTIFEGKTKVIAAGMVEYTHPAFGAIVLNMDDAVVIKAPGRLEDFKKLRLKAAKSKSSEDYIEAAREALRQGLLKDFYDCCSDAYKIEPENETLVRLIEARKRIKKPLGDSTAIESQLREATKLNKMKVAVSDHYVLFHDTADTRVGRRKQTRAETRLQLLETVYECYFLKFAINGIVLETPTEHLKVLLFAEESTFLRYSTILDPELALAAGFWSPKDNISVFYDQGSTKSMKLMGELAEDLKRKKAMSRGTAISQDMAQLSNVFDLLIKVAKEEADIEVVSHEATHQLAGNTGLMPLGKIGSRWAHEGLASYFETPSGAVWGGIGSVNQTRLSDYRKIARDPSRSPLELVVSDGLFYAARTQNQAVEAYGQAWALTYFLMETRFAKLIDYYKKCSHLANDASPRTRVAAFVEIFGEIRLLEREFNTFMKKLKTDEERIQDASR